MLGVRVLVERILLLDWHDEVWNCVLLDVIVGRLGLLDVDDEEGLCRHCTAVKLTFHLELICLSGARRGVD